MTCQHFWRTIEELELRKLFGPKGEHWTKKAYARTRNGVFTGPHNSKAVSWCLLGACYKLKIEMEFLRRAVPHRSLFAFNDADGFTPVKKLLQRIARGK